MARLSDLAPEVIFNICSQLRQDELLDIITVSRPIAGQAELALYTNPYIASRKGWKRFVRRINARPELGHRVRSLMVSSEDGDVDLELHVVMPRCTTFEIGRFDPDTSVICRFAANATPQLQSLNAVHQGFFRPAPIQKIPAGLTTLRLEGTGMWGSDIDLSSLWTACAPTLRNLSITSSESEAGNILTLAPLVNLVCLSWQCYVIGSNGDEWPCFGEVLPQLESLRVDAEGALFSTRMAFVRYLRVAAVRYTTLGPDVEAADISTLLFTSLREALEAELLPALETLRMSAGPELYGANEEDYKAIVAWTAEKGVRLVRDEEEDPEDEDWIREDGDLRPYRAISSTPQHQQRPADRRQRHFDAMAHVAHQLVLHPAISSSLKVGSTTVGRDKLYRSVQYFARFFSWYLYRKGYSKETVARWSNLKSSLGLSRKLMRIGKPMEHFQAAVKATRDVPDPLLRSLAIGRQLGYALYLINDMLVWAEKIKFLTFTKPTSERINKRAAQWWLLGLACSLVSGAVKTQQLRVRAVKAAKPRPSAEKESERKAELKAIKKQTAAVRYQMIQDSCDILLPSGSLGYHTLNEGILGAAGFTSSLMGLNTQITKVLGPK